MDDKGEKDVIVLDCGGGWVKAGWAGEDRPRVCIPCVVHPRAEAPKGGAFEEGGARKYVVLAGGGGGRAGGAEGGAEAAATGSKGGEDHPAGGEGAGPASAADASSGPAVYPIVRGSVTDWDALECVWEHVFEKELRVGATDDYSLVVTVSPLATAETRQRMAELAFRKFKMPSVCVVSSAVMSLYSTGRTRGLVLEIGEGLTSAVPVFEGFALPHATRHMKLAGADLTQHLMKRLSSRGGGGARFDSSHVKTVRSIKEHICAVAAEPFARAGAASSASSAGEPSGGEHLLYELPDGEAIRIDAESRFGVAEALFRPREVGVESPGIAELATEAVRACDAFLQADLLANVVVAGGTSMMAGIGERLRAELGRSCAEFGRAPAVVLDSQRRNAAWIGASMYGSLPTYNLIKITRQEYHDAGDAVVLKKSF